MTRHGGGLTRTCSAIRDPLQNRNVSLSPPSYPSARLRPRRAGFRFTRPVQFIAAPVPVASGTSPPTRATGSAPRPPVTGHPASQKGFYPPRHGVTVTWRVLRSTDSSPNLDADLVTIPLEPAHGRNTMQPRYLRGRSLTELPTDSAEEADLDFPLTITLPSAGEAVRIPELDHPVSKAAHDVSWLRLQP